MTSPVQTPPSNPPAKTHPAAPPVASPGRGRKPGIPAKERADIPSDEMQLILLPEKAKADRRRKREDRKDQQKAVDSIVYDVFEQNVELGMDHGTIADWADLFVYDWPVSLTHAETAIFLIGKGCRLYNRRPIWGEQIEVAAGKNHTVDDVETGEPVDCHLNGKAHVHIPFSVVRRTRKSSE
jgi:hypothetical protein